MFPFVGHPFPGRPEVLQRCVHDRDAVMTSAGICAALYHNRSRRKGYASPSSKQTREQLAVQRGHRRPPPTDLGRLDELNKLIAAVADRHSGLCIWLRENNARPLSDRLHTVHRQHLQLWRPGSLSIPVDLSRDLHRRCVLATSCRALMGLRRGATPLRRPCSIVSVRSVCTASASWSIYALLAGLTRPAVILFYALH
jgi:hypothetical protein